MRVRGIGKIGDERRMNQRVIQLQKSPTECSRECNTPESRSGRQEKAKKRPKHQNQ